MSEKVKRYSVLISEETPESKNRVITVRRIEIKEVVLVSDYDNLVEIIRELLTAGSMMHGENPCRGGCLYETAHDKALALVGEKGD